MCPPVDPKQATSIIQWHTTHVSRAPTWQACKFSSVGATTLPLTSRSTVWSCECAMTMCHAYKSCVYQRDGEIGHDPDCVCVVHNRGLNLCIVLCRSKLTTRKQEMTSCA